MASNERNRVQRIIDEVRGVKSLYGVTDWEWNFLDRLTDVAYRGLSEKQESVLAEIEAKVFPEKNEAGS